MVLAGLKGVTQLVERRLGYSLKNSLPGSTHSLLNLGIQVKRLAKTSGSSNLKAVHMFKCPDQLGIVATISECVASRGANILNVDLHIDFPPGKPAVYYGRSEFSFDPTKWPREAMERDFHRVANRFNAITSILRVMETDPPLRAAILLSLQEHCLIDILYKWQQKELPVEIVCVISNHDRALDTHVRRFLERHRIPYHYLPVLPGNKREDEILELVKDKTDFLVLARYMQVLSPGFLRSYGKDIINIHHGLLPSFKGGYPYRQAFQAGVKLIGATSHFVTEELDNGPIIEQLVDRVSHRDTLPSLALKSENLEKQCLAAAVKNYCEYRILQYSENKTIVFS